MELVTLKQFAADQGITYEAVRRQVIRYSEELSGHIIKKNRTQYLDEKAVTFLKERRRESPIVMVTMDQGEEIRELKEEVEMLRKQLISVQADLAKSQNERIRAQERVIELQNAAIEDKSTYMAMVKSAEMREDDLKQMIDKVQSEADDLRNEVQSFRRSIFGFYRKKKQ